MAYVREAVPYLLSDYDGTIARTSEKPVGGYDVNGAYTKAIEEIFGADAAHYFNGRGGSLNQTPSEIVADISHHVPIDPAQLKLYAAKLTHLKLEILIPQIGKANPDGSLWPRPTDGFVDFWNTLSQVRNSRTRAIGTGVISAGHTDFITTWFDTFELEPPDVLSTAEVVDNAAPHLSVAERTKPARLPLVLARAVLDDKYEDTINNIYYVGDDEGKDGGLATNTDSDFTLVDETDATPAWRSLGKKLNLPGYREVDA